MPLIIGTSGWQYRHWRGRFYPREVPQRRWLEHYAARFATVEVNNTFYRLPPPSLFMEWRRRTPDDFVVAVKASRYLTHIKQLRDPEEPVARLCERAVGLGPKLGPILVQLPPTLRLAPDRLEATLEAFAGVGARAAKRAGLDEPIRLAFEFRHPSWFDDKTYALLRQYDAALCIADKGNERTPEMVTASWGYVRLHQGASRPHPCYGRAALRSWAKRIASLWPSGRDVYVYCNNDGRACAVRDARILAEAYEHEGGSSTRVPEARETPVR